MKSNLSIKDLVRPNILALKPYSSAREDFTGSVADSYAFLDANENPYGEYNRYPDPYQNNVKERISQIKNIPVENIFLSNGSDEVIDLAYRIFCEPLKDKAIVFTPTYAMYEHYANIHQTPVVPIALDKDFNLPKDALETILQEKDAKLVFICSPNNPTANLLSTSDITKLVENFNGMVILDQAYIDFADQNHWVSKIDKYPNLILLQTLSKAWGGANLRVGMAFGSKEVLSYFNKVKSPYNISGVAQNEALKLLGDVQGFEKTTQQIKQQNKVISQALQELDFVVKVYPSDANFILVVFKDAKQVYKYLISKGIVVRDRSFVVPNALRISVGSLKQNERLIQELKKY